jgi:probable rRNA maturation factor
MQSLNATYRGKDQTTDVLSFAMTEGDFGDVNPDVLGDVVISVPTARRQATQARQPLLDRVTFLLAHGLLHLIGYDHETDEQHREMTRQTKRLMRKALDPKPITNKK